MIRVLIIDDSAVVRRILGDELAKHADIEVVDTAVDPYVAREKIARLRPDVLTLDIEMPRMDGLSFLEKLMRHFPIPTVVVSSLTTRNSETAIRALALGAVDAIAKPGSSHSTAGIGAELVRAVRAAAVARVRPRTEVPPPTASVAPRTTVRSPVAVAPARAHATAQAMARRVLAIGASTGGTQAIEHVLRRLPPDVAGTVIVQHMPEHFTAAFARRLDALCAIEVREASDGDAVVPGLALIAPGGKHMVLQASGTKRIVRIKDGPPVHHQRPAVDVLFQSVARHVGGDAVGVLLTGMGADGASGLLAMRTAGAPTIAQDEATSVVFGMPKEAIKLGAAANVVALPDIPSAILSALAPNA